VGVGEHPNQSQWKRILTRGGIQLQPPAHNPAVKIRMRSAQALWPVAKSGDRRVIRTTGVARDWSLVVSRPSCSKDLREWADSLVMATWSLARITGLPHG
jgi:hypothetical protein